jgi:hypothetical protein
MPSSGTPLDDERTLLAGLTAQLSQRLPRAWRVRLDAVQPTLFADAQPDAILVLEAPDGRAAGMAVEVRLSFYPRDVYTMSSQLGGLWPSVPRPAGRRGLQPDLAGWLVLSRFLTPRARELLTQAGFSYADASGNVRIESINPPLFLELEGADTNPRPADRTLRSLRGPGATRVVRALLDFGPPYTLRDLAERAGLPLGTASRTISYLIDEALVYRDGRGPIERVDWQGLLRRWARDYSLLGSNLASFYLEPRGPQALVERLKDLSMPYVLTGSFAVVPQARVADPALAAVYVPDNRRAARELNLKTVAGSGNVVLLEPAAGDVFQRPRQVNGFPCAALTQVAADLLTSPGRGPVEAEALIEWMGKNEDVWRHS